ncbi:hypothetical protein SCLCIDRAFT_299209 [Scleroderma citrinum Foug A]|uniref:Uncharacterized protein n=1 Tax=Scleroderma citrinum Foug A TaxID=1036808 RepID=A0A0C3DH63_9AGAM|nr:hypothetical protein SCLCIDRAFT_299209 [Scleroderma citrinum Foug A]
MSFTSVDGCAHPLSPARNLTPLTHWTSTRNLKSLGFHAGGIGESQRKYIGDLLALSKLRFRARQGNKRVTPPANASQWACMLFRTAFGPRLNDVTIFLSSRFEGVGVASAAACLY